MQENDCFRCKSMPTRAGQEPCKSCIAGSRFRISKAARVAELEAQLKEARDVLSGLIEWNDHEKGIPLTWVVERARAAIAAHEVKREEAK